MKSLFKIVLTVTVMTVLFSCGSGEKQTESSKQPAVVDTTSEEAVSDSVAPIYAEPDSVPGAPRAGEDTVK